MLFFERFSFWRFLMLTGSKSNRPIPFSLRYNSLNIGQGLSVSFRNPTHLMLFLPLYLTVYSDLWWPYYASPSSQFSTLPVLPEKTKPNWSGLRVGWPTHSGAFWYFHRTATRCWVLSASWYEYPRVGSTNSFLWELDCLFRSKRSTLYILMRRVCRAVYQPSRISLQIRIRLSKSTLLRNQKYGCILYQRISYETLGSQKVIQDYSQYC